MTIIDPHSFHSVLSHCFRIFYCLVAADLAVGWWWKKQGRKLESGRRFEDGNQNPNPEANKLQ